MMRFCVSLISVVAMCAFCAVAQEMEKVTVQGAVERLAVANDGSPQVFYYLPGLQSNLWVLALQGGWWCYNEATCQQRWAGGSELMSSVNLSATVKPDSLWSPSCLDNPFCLGQMVFMPYLTSDGYMGNVSAADNGMTWQFRGRPALTAVIQDLFNGFQLNNVTYKIPAFTKFVLTGFSAGAFGAFMNTNYIGSLVKQLCPTCSFYSIPDSGLFIGSVPDPLRNMAECANSVTSCSFADEIQISSKTWRSEPFLDQTCVAEMAILGQPAWHCMFGEIAAMYIKEDFFIIQYMFDAAELLADNGLDFLNISQLELAVTLAETKKILFKKFPSFLPACLGHCMATPHALDSLTIDNVALKTAINLWFEYGDKTSYIDSCTLPECRKGCT